MDAKLKRSEQTKTMEAQRKQYVANLFESQFRTVGRNSTDLFARPSTTSILLDKSQKHETLHNFLRTLIGCTNAIESRSIIKDILTPEKSKFLYKNAICTTTLKRVKTTSKAISKTPRPKATPERNRPGFKGYGTINICIVPKVGPEKTTFSSLSAEMIKRRMARRSTTPRPRTTMIDRKRVRSGTPLGAPSIPLSIQSTAYNKRERKQFQGTREEVLQKGGEEILTNSSLVYRLVSAKTHMLPAPKRCTTPLHTSSNLALNRRWIKRTITVKKSVATNDAANQVDHSDVSANVPLLFSGLLHTPNKAGVNSQELKRQSVPILKPGKIVLEIPHLSSNEN